MPFQKGKAKTGGKKKGQKHRKTLILNSFAESIVSGGMEKFQRELLKLKGKPFIDAYMTLFEYVKPKLARTELTAKDGEDLSISFTETIISKQV